MRMIEVEMTPERGARLTRATDRIIDVLSQEILDPIECAIVLTTLLETLKEKSGIDSAFLLRADTRLQ